MHVSIEMLAKITSRQETKERLKMPFKCREKKYSNLLVTDKKLF